METNANISYILGDWYLWSSFFSDIVLLIALLAVTLSVMTVWILASRNNVKSYELKSKGSKTGTNATFNSIINTESKSGSKSSSNSTKTLDSKKRCFNGKIHENGEQCKCILNKAIKILFGDFLLDWLYPNQLNDLYWLACVFVSVFLNCCSWFSQYVP